MKTALAGIVALIVAAPAHAATIRTETGQVPQPYAAWIDRSKMPVPAVNITLVPMTLCPEAGGCMVFDGGYKIAARKVRFALMHEIGHVFDREVMTPASRKEFVRATNRPWNEERFADAYGLCSISKTIIFDALSRWRPTKTRWKGVCRVIRRAYAGEEL
jgi:hypothetical protein